MQYVLLLFKKYLFAIIANVN